MIVIKGSETEIKEYVLKCLKRLDLRSNLPKCRFSKLEIVIGYLTYREQDLHYFVSRSAKDIKKIPFFSGLSTLYQQIHNKFSPN